MSQESSDTRSGLPALRGRAALMPSGGYPRWPPPPPPRRFGSFITGFLAGVILGMVVMAVLFMTVGGWTPQLAGAPVSASASTLSAGSAAVQEVTRMVEVTRPVEVTRVVEVAQPVEVTRPVEVIREVEVTREVVVVETPTPQPPQPTPEPVVQIQEVTRVVEVEVTRLVEREAAVAAAPPAEKKTVTAVIPFTAPGDPAALNPTFGWQPGKSEASAYDLALHPGALTLIVGSRTRHWAGFDTAPLIAYPLRGDFVAQVKVVFSPTRAWQHANLGVRSMENHKTWVRIGMRYGGGPVKIAMVGSESGRGIEINKRSWPTYSGDTVTLRLARRGSLFTFSYASNGVNWITLQEDYVFSMPEDTEIFLNANSSSNEGTLARFSEFQVTER